VQSTKHKVLSTKTRVPTISRSSANQFLGDSRLNTRAYLERINYRGSLIPTGETLRQLQVAHLLTVPFENLSIHIGQPIVLEDDALFTKIVENNRGGFCYEANGLFAALLRALGFEVAMLSAEVANADGEFSPAFAHMTLMVTLPLQRWLVDVGFGESFPEPLLIDGPSPTNAASRQPNTSDYRIHSTVADPTQLVLMRRDADDEWKAQYRFTLQSYAYADFDGMCRYHQTSPESHFTRSRICSRATKDGRITLSDVRLIKTTRSGAGEIRDERTIGSEEEYAAVLRDQFGIVLTT
jgi:N-hydroxyarylamine O-acetyltransferase